MNNQERASNAQVAVDAYAQLPTTDSDHCVSDLLCDLMHLCKQSGVSFKDELKTARMHFEFESKR